jgi:hypothetical protein
MLAANEAFARSGGAAGRAAVAPSAVVSPHAISRPPFVGHHRRANGGSFWPTTGGFFYGPPGGESMPDLNRSISNDIRYTYSYDVPWDWAHRFPPAVAPSDRPYVSSCPVESVTVPGRNGEERTVNVMRCY